MADDVRRIWHGALSRFQTWSAARGRMPGSRRGRGDGDAVPKVGDHYADYTPLSKAELEADDPDMKALLGRSDIVSHKRGV